MRTGLGGHPQLGRFREDAARLAQFGAAALQRNQQGHARREESGVQRAQRASLFGGARTTAPGDRGVARRHGDAELTHEKRPPVGDRALQEVANILRAGIRPYDLCVRYAGDEFVVVLSGCGHEEAEHKRVELQQAVDRVVFEGRPGKRVPLAISVGAAVFPHDGETYETLLAQADGRMYKDKGRRKRHSPPRSRSMMPATPSPAIEVSDEDIRRAAAGVL